MSLTLYFLRHGETQASKDGVFTGGLDVDLTPEGLQMAEDFASAYKSLPWAAVYCSPLRRAIHSAQPLCDAVGPQMQVRDGLREISFGAWEGHPAAEVNRVFHDEYVSYLADGGWNHPTGGERGVDVARRGTLVMEEIERTDADGNVLVLSHKATLRIMLCSLLGIDIGNYRDRLDMLVGSLAIVQMTDQGPMLKSFGDRSHLRPALRERSGT